VDVAFASFIAVPSSLDSRIVTCAQLSICPDDIWGSKDLPDNHSGRAV
jgi:hypothetical protein